VSLLLVKIQSILPHKISQANHSQDGDKTTSRCQ